MGIVERGVVVGAAVLEGVEGATNTGDAHAVTVDVALESGDAARVDVVLRRLLLAHLGAMSLTWNLVCVLLYPLLPRAHGTVDGHLEPSQHVRRRSRDRAARPAP